MKTKWERMTDAELAALPHAELLAARDAATAGLIDLDSRLTAEHRRRHRSPRDRRALEDLKDAVAAKRAFLVRLKPYLRAAAGRAPTPREHRRSVEVLADLVAALKDYAFDQPEDEPLRAVLAEATAVTDRWRAEPARGGR